MSAAAINDTVDLVKKAQGNPIDQIPDEIRKGYTQALGLVMYNLEAPAKLLVPVITPLRNRIARVGGGMGTAVNWKAITGINVNKLAGGVSEGNRGGVIATTVSPYIAAYKVIGFEDYVTFEANLAGKNFDDVKARAVENLLRALMIYEESLLLGGNSSLGLGTTPTPTVANAGTGGSIGAATYNIAAVALTLEGFMSSSVAGGVPASVSRTNADGSTDTYGGGSAQKSATAATTTTGSTSVITASVAPVRGAVGYAWYGGTAGNECLQAITSINSVSLTAIATGNQALSALPSSDSSQNALVYDGLISQVFGGASASLTSVQSVGSTCTIYKSTGTNGSGALVGQMATGTAGVGTVLTADGKGGIVEIDAMLRAFWDQFRLSPDTLYVNAQEAQNITAKILSGSSPTSNLSLHVTAVQDGLVGGMVVDSYLNKFGLGGAKKIKIEIHPNMTPGTILFYSGTIPYPLSGVGSVVEFEARQDYYQLEWPLRSRKYEYGVYADGVLKNYFPPAFGLLTNVANG
jgi:hypothetical protein